MTTQRTSKSTRDSLRDLAADAREIETHWLEAHHHFGDVPVGFRDAARLRAEMPGLQEEYVRLIEEARRHGRGTALALLPSILNDAPIRRDN
jgi:hypothetical protein